MHTLWVGKLERAGRCLSTSVLESPSATSVPAKGPSSGWPLTLLRMMANATDRPSQGSKAFIFSTIWSLFLSNLLRSCLYSQIKFPFSTNIWCCNVRTFYIIQSNATRGIDLELDIKSQFQRTHVTLTWQLGFQQDFNPNFSYLKQAKLCTQIFYILILHILIDSTKNNEIYLLYMWYHFDCSKITKVGYYEAQGTHGDIFISL